MNILLDTLPKTINLDGKKVPIKTDFRDWVRFTKILQDYNLDQMTGVEFVEMMEKIISTLFFESQKIQISFELFQEIVNFYVGFSERKNNKKKNDGPRTYDFVIDADAIYSSFYKEYGIRLIEHEMHWYEFRSLFSNLSENSPVGYLNRIRTMKESEVPAEKRVEFIELKEDLALPAFGSYVEDESVMKKLYARLK